MGKLGELEAAQTEKAMSSASTWTRRSASQTEYWKERHRGIQSRILQYIQIISSSLMRVLWSEIQSKITGTPSKSL